MLLFSPQNGSISMMTIFEGLSEYFCTVMVHDQNPEPKAVPCNLFTSLDDGDFQFKFTRMKTAATGPGAADTLLRAP